MSMQVKLLLLDEAGTTLMADHAVGLLKSSTPEQKRCFWLRMICQWSAACAAA